MNFSVKNVKIAKFASEETLCFEATVYVDGKRSFTAHNQGHGGPNSYYPLKEDINGEGNPYTNVSAATVWAQTQPKIVTDIKDKDEASGFFTYQPDLDHFIDKLVYEFEEKKEFKSWLRKFTILDGSAIYQWGCKPTHVTVRETARKKHPNCIFLNDLPFEDAFKAYKQAA